MLQALCEDKDSKRNVLGKILKEEVSNVLLVYFIDIKSSTKIRNLSRFDLLGSENNTVA